MKDMDLLNARLTKIQQDYDQQLLNCDQLATENTQKAAELKAKEDEINGLKQDTVRLTKMREAIQRKLRTVEDQKMEVEQQKETLKGQIAGLEKGSHIFMYKLVGGGCRCTLDSIATTSRRLDCNIIPMKWIKLVKWQSIYM